MKRIGRLPASLGFVFLVTLIYSCQSADTKSRLLRFNLENGKTYEYGISWDMEQEVMGQASTVTLSGVYDVAVTGEEAGVKTLTGQYQHFRMAVHAGGMDMEIDTDKPGGPMNAEEIKANPMGMASRIFAGIKGKTFTMKVDGEGKILAVKGFEKIVSDIIDSTGLPEDKQMEVRISLTDQFSDQAAKDQFTPVFNIFPNKAVKVGDSWQSNYSIAGRMPADFKTTYTVKSIEGDKITLATRSAIESTAESNGVSGEQSGTMQVNAITGLVTMAEFTQDITVATDGVAIKMKGKGMIRGKEK